jgi:hypothetical protein
MFAPHERRSLDDMHQNGGGKLARGSNGRDFRYGAASKLLRSTS